VGGSTRGSVSIPSIQARRLPCILSITLAANIPRKKVATVAAHVVASEIYSGEGSTENVTVRLL
jgi:hypothetical protein